MFFVYANGPLGVSVYLFKNSMVFHRLDNLISLTVHLLPKLTTWNLMWNTMPMESNLPEEKRYFLTLDPNEGGLSFFNRIFLIPLGLYLVWACLYFIKMFILSLDKIKARGYECLYMYYMNQEYGARFLNRFGTRWATVFFMSLHVLFFLVTSIFAMLAYHSFYLHTLLLFTWLTACVWYGANFYMEYFSRKYEASLRELEEVEAKLCSE